MAFFDTFSNPFEGMNIFGARLPTYLSGIPASEGVDATKGLLAQPEIDKLKNQALFQGLLGTAATYLSQPKNQGYGSALPYLAKAYLGGMQGSQGTYDQATQNLLTKSKLQEAQREAETAATIKDTQTTLMADKRVQDNPVLKALVAKGQFKDVADIISPKPAENDYDRYSFAYKEKSFKDLTSPEKQEIIKLVQEDKKANATQISFNQPMTAINPKTGKEELVQFPNKPGEKPIFTGLTKPEPETRLKPIPAGPATAYAENNAAIKAIDDAIAKVESANEDTFGLKNYLPGAITQRTDPSGVDARAAVSAIGSKKYHDISGAAVTISEAPRMAPFIPSSSDTKEKILQNLKNIRVQYEDTNNSLSSVYNQDQGYKPLNVPPATSSKPEVKNQPQNTPPAAQQNRAYIGNRAIVVKGNKWVYEDTGEVAQ
jgi:hypothetical protein